MLRNQAVIALIGLAALELEFAAMARLGDLKLHVIETIILALAAGAIYCVALYALEHSRERRAAFWLILGGALLFRLTLAPLPPTLSTDMYRYRWDGRVQNAGWNPYSVNALDPRLKSLRDSTWAGMPGPEVPAIYPPLAELIFRGTARITQSPLWLPRRRSWLARTCWWGRCWLGGCGPVAGGTTSSPCMPGVR